MQKNTKIGILVLMIIFIIIVGLVLVNLSLNKKKAQLSPGKIVLPVSQEFFQKNLLSPSLEADHLVFSVPIETPVYSLFKAKVTRLFNDKEFVNIQLTASNGLIASYLVSGEVLVKENDEVSEGQLIAKVNSSAGAGVLGGGNFGLYLFENGQLVPASRFIK